jgi:UDP-N-acetylmuramate dehydrogenase
MKENISLKELHTFGLAVNAAQYTLVETEQQVQELLPLPAAHLILGGGSNMLFTKDFEGLVVHNKIRGIELVEENDETVLIRVGGGEVWHLLVVWCIEQGYAGLENLSLIPGSVGAAPIQNIGAYGVELKDVFERLEAINLSTGKIETLHFQDCAFGYRDSIFKGKAKGRYFITRVFLRLSKQAKFNISYGAIQQVLETSQTPLSIRSISNAVIQIRTQKLPDPKEIGNSGSFFKNPIVANADIEALKKEYPSMPVYPIDDNHSKLAAGWLIDQLGWKGYRKGDAGVHEQQALVLVNYDNAKGSEIWELAQEIQLSVREKFGVLLEPEVNILS